MSKNKNLNNSLLEYYRDKQRSNYILLLLVLIISSVNIGLLFYENNLEKSSRLSLAYNDISDDDYTSLLQDLQALRREDIKKLIKLLEVNPRTVNVDNKTTTLVVEDINQVQLEELIEKLEKDGIYLKITSYNDNSSKSRLSMEVIR